MILFAGFIEVLLRSLTIIGLSLSVGGVFFAFIILRPLAHKTPLQLSILRRSLSLSVAGGILVALSQGLVLIIEPWALADEMGQWPISQFLATGFAHAGLIHAGLAIFLVLITTRLMTHPFSRIGWLIAIAAAILLMASGAWLVHGVSRLEHAASLMIITVLHQFGAALWVGGITHLLILRRFKLRFPEHEELWLHILPRFSPFAMFSVSVLLAAGLYLALSYIGSWQGLFGTAYGMMVLTKFALLSCALCLGAFNFFSIQHWKQHGNKTDVLKRVPVSLEAEVLLGVIILLAAASLTSQPPSIDIRADSATLPEVVHVLAPKIPQLVPPPYQEMLSQAVSSFDPFAVSSKLDRIQSNFNHNIAGLIVLLTGMTAALFRTRRSRCAHHWPLLFLLLSIFLLFYAEPTGWPLGKEGFWSTLIVPGVLQHRLATLLVAILAMFEWRVQAGRLGETRWKFAFPLLCLIGGALLLTHSHSAFALKQAFLIEVSHNILGFLAVLTGLGRLLELRFPKPMNEIFGFVWSTCLILVGLVLLFYQES
ncbi:MAG TPA: CopD family protein [Nitrospirota bacterium]|nr:CopD family protein [Nitrospirota bacterium]